MNEPEALSAGQVNESAAEIYEAFFVPALFGQWCNRMLDAAGVSKRDAVLDVGCGTGTLARAAARRLSGAGTTTAIDLNEGMLAVARRMPERISWHHGQAERLPFADDAFDRVVSQFAIMFFADRVAAVAEMARVTRPGGTIAIATWAAIEESPGYAAMVELLHRLFGERVASALRAPFLLGSDDALDAVIGPVLPSARITRHEGVAQFESIEAWVHTDIRGWTLADMIDDEQYAELLATARADLHEFVDADGWVRFAAPALITTATVPVG